MTITIRTALLVLSLASVSACGRWMDYTPVRIQAPGLTGVPFAALVQRAQSLGYRVECQDPARGTFCVRAHLDQRRGRRTHRTSIFHVAVSSSSAVDVSASGFHVRDQGTVIHRRLCDELTGFVDGLAATMVPGAAPPRLLVGRVD